MCFVRRLLLACVLTALLPASATAASRMLVGFQDDPSFRWRDDRQAVLDRAAQAGVQVIRTTVYWSRIAPTRPASPSNPFDRAYRFDDLDELIRAAQLRGIEVMLTIWGTPEWANQGQGQSHLPTRLTDLRAFAQALAARYSGRFSGYPFAHYFSVWNESNLEQFLAPQFDPSGRSLAPALYAKLYRAAYAGIKSGNPSALVAIGETSSRGRDKPSPGRIQDTHSPGRFAELLSKIRPRLEFDAYSQHPYPTAPNLKPTQRVRWPNVTLTQLPRFERSLDAWFGRKDIPIWITEYGHETKPQEPRGVSYSQQAAYVRQALGIARRDPRVRVFVWFIFRDDPTSTWQSGLLTERGATKPALAAFSALARAVDGRNQVLTVRAGSSLVVRVPALELAARSGVGARVGITYQVLDGGQLLEAKQPESTIGLDGWVSFQPGFAPQAGRRYTVTVDVGDVSNNHVFRTVELVAAR